MCLTIPAQIIKLNGPEATVRDHAGVERQVLIAAIPDAALNSWVLITANLALKQISASEADEINNIINSPKITMSH